MTLPALYRPVFTASLPDVVTLDGWTASATDDQNSEWWLTGLEGWHGGPDLRLTGVDRAQDHGQFDGTTYFGSRVITASGTTVSPDRTTALLARDIVSSLCWDPTQLYTLQVTEPGRPTRQASVRLNTGIKVSEVSDCGFDWQVQWKAPDPRKYDSTLQTVTLNPPTGAAGGVTVPLTVPFTLSTTGLSTSAATVTNSGTATTRPVVTLTGPLVDPQIANVTAGKTLSLTITVAATDVLTLDFDRRTVLLNGSASRSSTLTASAAWWELPPGGSDLQFTAGGGSGSAVVAWRSSWI